MEVSLVSPVQILQEVRALMSLDDVSEDDIYQLGGASGSQIVNRNTSKQAPPPPPPRERRFYSMVQVHRAHTHTHTHNTFCYELGVQLYLRLVLIAGI